MHGAGAERGRGGWHWSSARVGVCSRCQNRTPKSSVLLMDKDRWQRLIQANKRGDELTVQKTEALWLDRVQG